MTDGELAKTISKYVKEKKYKDLEEIIGKKIEEDFNPVWNLLKEVIRGLEEIIIKEDEDE